MPAAYGQLPTIVDGHGFVSAEDAMEAFRRLLPVIVCDGDDREAKG